LLSILWLSFFRVAIFRKLSSIFKMIATNIGLIYDIVIYNFSCWSCYKYLNFKFFQVHGVLVPRGRPRVGLLRDLRRPWWDRRCQLSEGSSSRIHSGSARVSGGQHGGGHRKGVLTGQSKVERIFFSYNIITI